LIALKKQAIDDPEKEQEYKDFLTEFYESQTGKDISQIVQEKNKLEKAALG